MLVQDSRDRRMVIVDKQIAARRLDEKGKIECSAGSFVLAQGAKAS